MEHIREEVGEEAILRISSLNMQSSIQKITERLVEAYHPQKIILFGSHAWGEPNEDSDVDLLIIKETPVRFLDRCLEARRSLRGVEDRIPKDIFVLTPEELSERVAIQDPFIQEIIGHGIELYAA
ncbi:MAG: nucleotidyltransferase domain-containing protein [bacterium]|nr:nucleotidyltransferase domain-containing protein [bacterium]